MLMALSRPPNNWSNASAPVTDSKTTPAISTAPLSLDTELRLLPQQLSLGKAELLTDALMLPFTDIESRLGHYALSSSDDEMKSLVKNMKNYLGRLNANPHIPLTFRLNVLKRFEQELDLFDAEMTAAVLNAHKIGVILVQEAARNDSAYYPTLIDMIANAIELAVKLLLMNMEQYRAPSVIVTRQFFDLARLGLDVSAAMGDAAPSKTARLNKALCNHEMLRKMDFFCKTTVRQQQLWQELQCHIGVLTPLLHHSGDRHDHGENHAYMMINLNRPNDPGRIIKKLPNPIEYDCIIIALAPLVERLDKAIRSVSAVFRDRHMQKKALHTEQALENTLIGGKAILSALQNDKRDHARSKLAEARVQISFDLPETIIKAFSASEMIEQREKVFNQAHAWTLIDISQHGVCLERIHAGSLSVLPGYLIGLNWLFGEDMLTTRFAPWKEHFNSDSPEPPALGFIRWVKVLKAGEQRIGIDFFSPGFKLAKAIIHGGSQSMDAKRSWPVLIKAGKSSHSIIFPETKVYKHMTFMLEQGNQHAYFKITAITDAGQNYSQCNMIRAKASGTSTG